MAAWKLIEVADDDPEAMWTDAELIGVSILLTQHSPHPHNDRNVYWRAREKVQSAVTRAIDRDMNVQP
jgi:hypothetical protein